MKKYILLLFMSVLSVDGLAHESPTLNFEADTRHVRIIEIYSSQGCSSCPPAERWVNTLKGSSHLWQTLYPMVFHVDYWNFLGWRDPYSSPEYSDRQRDYKRQTHVNAVYTPGFMVNGREWRGWFQRKGIPSSSLLSGKFTVALRQDQVSADFENFHPSQVLNMAIIGFELDDHILAGENRNLKISQNFIVLSHQRFLPTSDTSRQVKPSSPRRWQVDWQRPSIKAPRYAVLFWIDKTDDLTPLQIAGNWLPDAFIPVTGK